MKSKKSQRRTVERMVHVTDAPRRDVADVGPPVLSRIDAAHPMNDGPPVMVEEAPAAVVAEQIEASPIDGKVEAASAATGRSAPHLTEQLQTQALQLGTLLRSKQRELDRREALMNARDAKLDNELRMARLWVRERDEDVREREHDFAERVKQLEEKTAQVASVEVSHERDRGSQQVQLALRDQACNLRFEQLEQREQRLAAELEALETARTRLEQQRVEDSTAQLAAQQKLALQQAEIQRQTELQQKNFEQLQAGLAERERSLAEQQEQLAGNRDREAWEARLAARQSELDQAETLLAIHAREIDEQRVELAAARERHALEARDERRELAQWQQGERAELSERKQQLAIAEEALETHRAAVEQLRNDAARMHREAIEMRLVSEQLWLELSKHVPPAELTRSLAVLRQRLADHYRESHDKLTAQQAELMRLGNCLDEQQRRLVEQREQLRAWLAAQQQDIEAQAARLVAREQHLDSQEEAAKLQEARWHKERRELREHIRELLGRLRREAVAA
jgi:hypothetical protein